MDKVENMLASLSLWVSDAVKGAVSGASALPEEDVAVLVLAGQERLRITDLAVATGRTHSAAVRAIDRLAVAGLVTRVPATDGDARAVVIELTPEGDLARAAALAARARAVKPAMQALTQEQRHSLGPLLEAVLAAVTTSPAAGTRICRLCDEDSCVPAGCPVEDRCQILDEATSR